MALTKGDLEGLDFALEDAELLGVEVDPTNRIAGVTLVILWDPESGPATDDLRFQLVLEPVGRVVASLRHGSWDDRKAVVEPLTIRDLPGVFRLRGDRSIYGSQFFDVAPKGRREARDSWFVREAGRLSLDWRAGGDGHSHTLDLFSEGYADNAESHLDLRLWFDDLWVYRPGQGRIAIHELVAGARRWWEAWEEEGARTTSVRNDKMIPLGRRSRGV